MNLSKKRPLETHSNELSRVQLELRKQASLKQRLSNLKFFKTKPGEYAHGDQFIGVNLPNLRIIAKANLGIDEKTLTGLMISTIHEERLLALIILVSWYQSAKTLKKQERLFHFFMDHREYVNNWDLVDTCSPKILGHYCYHFNQSKLLFKLIKSEAHWDRRLAMVATAYYISQNDIEVVFALSQLTLNDPQDLMHKASGWMLREAGKKDPDRLRSFLKDFGSQLPRTMLRYSIEKFSPTERKMWLTSTRT